MKRIVAVLALVAVVAGATPAPAQIMTQKPIRPVPPTQIAQEPIRPASPPPQPQDKPNVFRPNSEQKLDPLPPPPPDGVPKNTLGVSWDRKGWVTTIDGRNKGIEFRLGSEHVIRGAGLSGPVAGWIMSSRLLRGTNKYETVGSVLGFVRQSDHELMIRVTQIAGGKLPWSRLGHLDGRPIRLDLRVDGGGRAIQVYLRDSTYRCLVGEPNCE